MRRRLLVLRVLVPVVSGAVLLGACGSDKPEPAGPGFVEAADAVCARYDAELGALAAPADREMAAVLLDKVVVIDDGRLGDLRELVPPSGSGPRVARFLEAHRRVLDATVRAATALRAGEADQYADLVQDAADAVRDVRTGATALRLTACAAYRSRVTGALVRLPSPPAPPKETTTPTSETTVPASGEPDPDDPEAPVSAGPTVTGVTADTTAPGA